MNSADSIVSHPVPLLEMRGLTKTYQTEAGPIPVIRRIDLRILPGEMVSIMGPSGSGKSTLLFILGLFLPPTDGVYEVNGRDVLRLNRIKQAEFRRTGVGFVFQSCNLIENTTVYENLEFPLIYAGVKRHLRSDRIREALERVNLGHRIHHRTNRLSGGEQQRVAVARALVNRPRIILADEPSGQLDHDHTELILDYLQQSVTRDTAMIVVTHDPDVAARCGRSCLLKDGFLNGVEEPCRARRS